MKRFVFTVLVSGIAAAAPCQEPERPAVSGGPYIQVGLWAAGVTHQSMLLEVMGGLKAGAGFGIPLGAVVLSLGAETGIAFSGMAAAALNTALDVPITALFSMGAGLNAGGCFRAGKTVSPLLGGRLRMEIRFPWKREAGPTDSLSVTAGTDISLEWAGIAVLPVFEIGPRVWLK
jgi:hypothetical protein